MKITVTRHAKIGDKEEIKTATIEIEEYFDIATGQETNEEKVIQLSQNLFNSMDKELNLYQ